MVSSEFCITLYNSLTYSLAVLLLVSPFMKTGVWRYSIAYILLVVSGMLLIGAQNMVMPITVCLMTISLSGSPKEYRRTFYWCLTAIFIAWCFIVTLSSLVMLASPQWHGGTEFNYLMGGVLLVFALTVRSNLGTTQKYKWLENTSHPILIELLILLFFSFVLPSYYPVIATESKRQWGVFSLSFMLVLLFVALLINRIKDLEHTRRELATRIEQQQTYSKQVQAQFEKVVTLKHYYNKLYHSLSPLIRDKDINRLQLYFQQYIAPIHREQIQNQTQISSIKSELIRNLLDVTAGQVASLEHVVLDMRISETICIPASMELDVFEIMSILMDNALNELAGQTKALLRIEVTQMDGQIAIAIANTLHCDIRIEQIYNQKQYGTDVHGYGLKHVRALVYKHPEMEHFTYKSGVYEGKGMLTQQIKIQLEGS